MNITQTPTYRNILDRYNKEKTMGTLVTSKVNSNSHNISKFMMSRPCGHWHGMTSSVEAHNRVDNHLHLRTRSGNTRRIRYYSAYQDWAIRRAKIDKGFSAVWNSTITRLSMECCPTIRTVYLWFSFCNLAHNWWRGDVFFFNDTVFLITLLLAVLLKWNTWEYKWLNIVARLKNFHLW